jgi:hypothetical protein
MPHMGFEPTTPVFQRAKTFHTLDRAATMIPKLSLLTGRDGRRDSHIFSRQSAHKMAVRLSALRAGRPPFIPWKIPGTHFC